MRNATRTTQSSGLRSSSVLYGGRKNQSKITNAASAIAAPRRRPPEALDPRTTSRKTSATWALSSSALKVKSVKAATARLANATLHLTGLLTRRESISDSRLGEDVPWTQG